MSVYLKKHPNWHRIMCPIPRCIGFGWGDLKVYVGEEEGIGWHLSISHPRRLPTWEEVYMARYDHVPHDVTMAMILPPTDEYVNLHKTCFHLHQIPNEGKDNLIDTKQ